MKLKPNPQFIKDVSAKDRKRWSDALLACTRLQAHNVMIGKGGAYCCLMVGLEAFGGTDEDRTSYKPSVNSAFTLAMGNANPFITSACISATGCNDDLGLTFAEIAALVYPEATEEAT